MSGRTNTTALPPSHSTYTVTVTPQSGIPYTRSRGNGAHLVSATPGQPKASYFSDWRKWASTGLMGVSVVGSAAGSYLLAEGIKLIQHGSEESIAARSQNVETLIQGDHDQGAGIVEAAGGAILLGASVGTGMIAGLCCLVRHRKSTSNHPTPGLTTRAFNALGGIK